MSAVLGLLLITLAVLLYGGGLVASRRRVLPGWLGESAASAIVITTIGLFVMGIGLTVQFAVSYGREPLGWVESRLIGGMLILMAVAFAAIGRLLRRQVPGTEESAEAPHTTQADVVQHPPASASPSAALPPSAPSFKGRSRRKRAA